MAALFTLFAFLITILHGARCHIGARYECPSADLSPCKCLDTNGTIILQCYKLASGQQLASAIKGMSGYGITKLEIRYSNVSYIPHDLFKGSPVSQIIIKNSAMFYLFDRDLERNAEHVTDIDLDHVNFEGGLDWSILESLKFLKTMVVYETNVENIPYGASELELPLETLMLDNNYIEYVYETAFQNLKDLKNLKLSKNFLKEYHRSLLPLPTSGIQFLDLSFNKLKSLPADAFNGMPDLHSLLLRGNLFTVLEKSYMSIIFPSLVYYLDVSQNPLLCNCEMTWTLSESKPFHFLGECSSVQEKTVKRQLKDLTKKDFAQCT